MANIKVTKGGKYANPVVSIPHLEVKEGEIVSVSDAMAARMCGNGVAEMYEGEATNTNDASIEALVDDYGKPDLVAACEAAKLDASGTKTELATRLVDAGIIEIKTGGEE